MKSIIRYGALGLILVPVVVFFAFNHLSASAVKEEPLSSFSATSWAVDPVPVANPSPEKSWVKSAREVLAKIEDLEFRLDKYEDEVNALDASERAVDMADTMALDKNPARALETLLNRMKGMVDTYRVLDVEARDEFSDMGAVDQLEALDAVSEKEAAFNAYLDRLATKRAEHLAELKMQQDVAFEISLAVRVVGDLVVDGAGPRLETAVLGSKVADVGLHAVIAAETAGVAVSASQLAQSAVEAATVTCAKASAPTPKEEETK